METMRFVAQWHEPQSDACRLDAAIEASLRDLNYGRSFLV
jgi:hypothetical protein